AVIGDRLPDEPLDIVLRRVSLGRRELVAARDWVGGLRRRRRAAGPRTATAEGMLAASGRVRIGVARAAIRAPIEPDGGVPPVAGPRSATNATPSPIKAPPSSTPMPSAAPAVAPSEPPQEPSAATAPDTIGRLREAKRRARGR
ncbi:MAG: hypothetical protein ABI553_08270, partial [Chloroflexota bacterium]